MPIRVSLIIATIVALLSAATDGRAQDWPTRDIRVIVPVSAGSAADIVARTVLDQLSRQLGQPMVVENRPGASSTIGARAVAHADPDGYTLLAISSAHTIAPATVPDLGYDAVKDFAAVTSLGSMPNVLVIAPSKNIHSLAELVAAAKVKPITFGSTGVGSPIRLAMERLRTAAKFDAEAIPFKGAPEALLETMTGRIDCLLLGSPAGAAVNSQRQAHSPGGEQPGPRHSSPGRADDPRSGIPGFRLHLLGRRLRAVANAACDRR